MFLPEEQDNAPPTLVATANKTADDLRRFARTMFCNASGEVRHNAALHHATLIKLANDLETAVVRFTTTN